MMVTDSDLYVVLGTIHSAGEIMGRKRFQKTICLLKHQNGVPLGFNFIPYFYGPYSEELAESIQALVGAGYVRENANEVADGIYQYSYSLTEQGKNALQHFMAEKQQVYGITFEELENISNQITKMELNDLVRTSKTLDLNIIPQKEGSHEIVA